MFINIQIRGELNMRILKEFKIPDFKFPKFKMDGLEKIDEMKVEYNPEKNNELKVRIVRLSYTKTEHLF